MYRTVSINDIEVGERARVDLGDLTDLADSIAEMGLLQPIVVTEDHKLIAGHRRLESCRRLDWPAVPVVVAEHIHDAVDLLKAERDENTCRKPMTASELIALGRQIEALERPKAAERKAATQLAGRAPGGTPIGAVPANGTDRYDSRDKAADAVGMSTATYSRVKQIANAADGYEESRGDRVEVSAERQEQSREAMELIDRITAGEEVRPAADARPLTVTAVYEQWKGHKINRGRAAPTTRRRPEPAVSTAPPLTDVRGRRLPQRSVRHSINEGMAALSGLCIGFSGVHELPEDTDAEEAALWQRDLDQVLRVLRSFNTLLKEYVNATR